MLWYIGLEPLCVWLVKRSFPAPLWRALANDITGPSWITEQLRLETSNRPILRPQHYEDQSFSGSSAPLRFLER